MGAAESSTVEPARTRQLVESWEEQRPAALAWLNSQVGEVLPPTTAGLWRAWSWYCTWCRDPGEASAAPFWWVEGRRGVPAAAAWGLDAIAHLREATAHHYLPGLVRSFEGVDPGLIREDRHGGRIAWLPTFHTVWWVSERSAAEANSEEFRRDLEKKNDGFRRGLDSMARRAAIDELEAQGVRVGQGPPADPSWVAAIADVLASKKWHGREWGIYEATLLGDQGEEMLIAATKSPDQYLRQYAARALCYLSSSTSLEVLRGLVGITGPGCEDLQYIAINSIAHRLHEQAHDDLVVAFRHPKTRPRVRGTVVDLLGVWSSSDEVWDEVFKWVRKNLATPNANAAATVYLLRHAGEQPGRAERLAEAVRSYRETFNAYDLDWFAKHWPDVLQPDLAPGDVALPDLLSYLEPRREKVREETLPRPPLADEDPFAALRQRPSHLTRD